MDATVILNSLHQPNPASPDARWFKDLLVVILVSSLWFTAFIGLRPLANPDEGRYTEIAREMALSGDYVTPRLNGVKYFEKPPLVYWLSALTFRGVGVNEFTARLWTALFAILGVVLTYLATRSLYGRAAGFASAVVLATSLLYYALGQVILLDMPLAATLSGALFCFLLANREAPGRRRLGLFLAFYAFMALATLTKGLIGFLIPGAVIFLWLLLLNRWRTLRPFHPVAGVLLFLAIAAPWHVLAAQANRSDIKELDFTWFYFVHEHFLRFTTRVHGRYEPWWFFLPMVIAGLFPWIFFAPQSLGHSLRGGWGKRNENAEAWFLVIWIVFIVAFFSKSQSKLIPYILPVMPPAAVLIGRYLSAWLRIPADGKLRAGARSFAGCAVLLGIAIAFVPAPAGHEGLAALLPVLRAAACITLLAGAALTFAAVRKDQPRRMIGSIAATAALLLIVVAIAGKGIDGGSTASLSNLLRERLLPGDEIYHVGLYAQDMPVYLKRQVKVVGYKGELLFGVNAEPEATADRFILKDGFVEQWARPGTRYAVIRRWYYDHWFQHVDVPKEIIGQSNELVLLVNRAPSPPP